MKVVVSAAKRVILLVLDGLYDLLINVLLKSLNVLEAVVKNRRNIGVVSSHPLGCPRDL